MITIYRTLTCVYCHQVAKLCDKFDVAYKFIDLDDDPILRQELLDKTGFMTVPITTDGKTYIVGWQPAQLLKLIK